MAPQAPRTKTAHIAGVGSRLPAEPVDNETLARTLRISREWIDAFVGTRTRHFSRDPDTGRVRWSLADLCAHAADRALADAGIDPSELEFVVLATATPDALMPATVNEVADRLGVNHVPTFQLQSGCAGAVQALDLAHGFIASGRHRTGLVMGGDVCAKHLDLRDWIPPRPATAPGELINLVLFGDGAGAAVLTDRPEGHALAVRHVVNRLTGTGRAPGQSVAWFGAAEKPGRGPAFQEDYKAIERLVPAMAADVAWEILDELRWKPEQLDYVLPPQLSGRMTALIVEELALGDAQEVSCVADTGNTGNALPFLQLERLAAVIAPGQRALAVAIESSKWIKTGLALERAHPGADGCGA